MLRQHMLSRFDHDANHHTTARGVFNNALPQWFSIEIHGLENILQRTTVHCE